MSGRPTGGGRRGMRDQIRVLPPVLVAMTVEEHDRVVVAIARLLVELAASSAPSGTPVDHPRDGAAPDGGWPSGAESS